jgi:prevent-host-death family protein
MQIAGLQAQWFGCRIRMSSRRVMHYLDPMDEVVSATEANRSFSQILRSVRSGRSYVVTSHGKVVARIVTVQRNRALVAVAKAVLMARFRAQRP